MIERLGPHAPLAIALLVGAVWAIEHFARTRMGPAFAAKIGVPLPGLTRSLQLGLPEPIPDNWLTGFVPLGNETWLLQDDATHWCFGVLSARRDGAEVVLTMQRRMPFAWPASVAGMAAMAVHLGDEPMHAALVIASWSLIWTLQIVRSYRWIGETMDVLTDRLRVFATP